MEDRGVGAGLRACPPNGQPHRVAPINYCETEPLPAIFYPRLSILHLPSSILMLMMRLMLMPAAMFCVAKDQRFDHHRHRLGVGQLLADVDEVEVF